MKEKSIYLKLEEWHVIEFSFDYIKYLYARWKVLILNLINIENLNLHIKKHFKKYLLEIMKKKLKSRKDKKLLFEKKKK